MLNNSRDENIKERLLPLKENLERKDGPSALRPNTSIQQRDDEGQDSQPDDEEQVMMKDKLLSPLMIKSMIDDQQEDSQSENPLFQAIDNLQFTN
jgi:hypothetical protein